MGEIHFLNTLGGITNLTAIDESVADSGGSADGVIIWDNSASEFKYMTLDNLQDEIDTSGSAGFAVGDITGATELASGLASTDELILSDGGVLKRMDISVIQAYMQSNLTFTTNTNTNQLTTFQLEDNAGTEVTISHGKEVKLIGGTGITTAWTDTSTGSDGDPYDMTISLDIDEITSNASDADSVLTIDGDGTLTAEADLQFNETNGLVIRTNRGIRMNNADDDRNSRLYNSGASSYSSIDFWTGNNTTPRKVVSINHLGNLTMGHDGTNKTYVFPKDNTGASAGDVLAFPSSGYELEFVAQTDTNTNQLTTFTLTGDSGSNQVIAHGNTVDIAGGNAISTVVGDTDTVTINHDDTSSQASVNNSGRTYIQDITLDTYGHVTAISSATETVTNTDTNTQLSNEQVQDIVGAMFSSNTETRISATYQDGDGTIDLVVDDMTADTNTQLSQEQVEDFVDGLLTAGSNVSLTYNDSAGTLTIASTDTNTQLTQEQVEDYVAGVVTAGSNVSVSYNDSAGTLTIASTDTNTQLSQEQVEDYVNGLIVGGTNVTATYDDSAGTLTLASTDTNTTYSAGTGLALSSTTFNLDINGLTDIGSSLALDDKIPVYNLSGTAVRKMDVSRLNGVLSELNLRDARNEGPSTSAEMRPTDFSDKSAVFTFTDDISSSTNAWDSVLTMKGWTDTYRAWQIFSASDNSSNSVDTEPLYFRSGEADVGTSLTSDDGGWGARREILTFPGTTPNADGNADQVLITNGSGVLSWGDQAGASGEANQNAFTTVAVSGQTNVVADSTTDTLTLAEGSNVTITTNASSDTVTIAASNYVHPTSAGNVHIPSGGASGQFLKYSGVSGVATWATPSYTTNTNTQLSDEQVQDIVGAMFSGNTETRITATYQDGDGTIDLTVDDMTTDTNTQLSNEQVQDIVGAMFTGNTETNITATYQDADGTIDLVATDTNTQLSTEAVQDIVGAMFSGNTETRITATYQDGDGTIDLSVDDMTADTNTQLSNEQVQDIVGAMFTGNTETNITATYQDADGTIDLVASSGGGSSTDSFMIFGEESDDYLGPASAGNANGFSFSYGNGAQNTTKSSSGVDFGIPLGCDCTLKGLYIHFGNKNSRTSSTNMSIDIFKNNSQLNDPMTGNASGSGGNSYIVSKTNYDIDFSAGDTFNVRVESPTTYTTATQVGPARMAAYFERQ